MNCAKLSERLVPGVMTAGAWGTALAETMAQAGHEVLIWDRDAAVLDDINRLHENRRRYPGMRLDERVVGVSELKVLCDRCNVVFIAVPSLFNPELAQKVAKFVGKEHCLVMASKGLREKDGALMTTVWREACPEAQQLVLSGPTFAREVMERKVTTCVLAGENAELRSRVGDLLSTSYLRVYESDDVVGCQVGGALKNIMAVAAGIVDGLELGYNARAALLSRGLMEVCRYANMMGGEERTICGLSGLGDVILTSTSPLSRNYRFGQMVGKGMPLAEAQAKLGTVEGIAACRIATVQAQARGLDLAVISAIDGVLHGDVTPLRVVEYLMQRPRMGEFDW